MSVRNPEGSSTPDHPITRWVVVAANQVDARGYLGLRRAPSASSDRLLPGTNSNSVGLRCEIYGSACWNLIRFEVVVATVLSVGGYDDPSGQRWQDASATQNSSR